MNLWNQNGIPHKGWHWLGCDDTGGEYGDGYETCQMCGNEKVRYVHIMKHAQYANELRVGCDCAENMSEDYVGPKKKEKLLKNKAVRHVKWFRSTWSMAKSGCEVIRMSKRKVAIYKNPYTPEWQYCIDNQWCADKFLTRDDVKLAAYNKFLSLEKIE